MSADTSDGMCSNPERVDLVKLWFRRLRLIPPLTCFLVLSLAFPYAVDRGTPSTVFGSLWAARGEGRSVVGMLIELGPFLFLAASAALTWRLAAERAPGACSQLLRRLTWIALGIPLCWLALAVAGLVTGLFTERAAAGVGIALTVTGILTVVLSAPGERRVLACAVAAIVQYCAFICWMLSVTPADVFGPFWVFPVLAVALACDCLSVMRTWDRLSVMPLLIPVRRTPTAAKRPRWDAAMRVATGAVIAAALCHLVAVVCWLGHRALSASRAAGSGPASSPWGLAGLVGHLDRWHDHVTLWLVLCTLLIACLFSIKLRRPPGRA